MVFCNKCGASLPDGQTLCPHCGNAIAPAQVAPPHYAPAPQQPPVQRVGMSPKSGLPPAVAAILTPLGLAPLIATLLCWIGWFMLPGVSVGITAYTLGANSQASTLWQALGYVGGAAGDLGNGGSAGFTGVIVVLCLLIPFAVPFAVLFVPGQLAKLARLVYFAPLFAFIVAWLVIEHTLSGYASLYNAATADGSIGNITVSTTWGIGTYLVVLMSLVVAACAVLPLLMPKLAAAGVGSAPLARAGVAPPAYAPQVPHAPHAYAPPPPAAYAPAPVAHVAQAPAQEAGYCTSCGKPRATGSQFCTSCGARFTA